MFLPVPVMYKIDEDTKKERALYHKTRSFLMHYKAHQVMDTFKRMYARLLLNNSFFYFIFGGG